MSDSALTSAVHAVRAWLPQGDALPDRVWRSRHRVIVTFAWLHVPALLVVAVVQERSAGQAVFTAIWPALFAFAASLQRPPRVVLASMATLSLLTSTALLIHSFHGLIEIHFLFFVVIAVVASYQQWTPYLVALLYVVVHHGLLGVLMPTAVYNHASAIDNPLGYALVHGLFVFAESLACLAYWKATEQALDAEREQRQRAEEISAELTAANREMADLMAMVSHDLRAPLTVINGAAELALSSWDDIDDRTRQAIMRKVGNAGQSLEEMLEETLTLSALDAQGLQSRPVPVRVDEVVRSMLVDQIGSLADVNLDGLQPATALVDKSQFNQIAANLITNAAKYGRAPFTVSSTTSGSVVEVTIADAGDGVPAAFVSRLFDRYARADEARAGGQRGTGLGLYIVRELMRSNKGAVTYRPAEPHGSEFVLHLVRAPHAVAGGDASETTPPSPVAVVRADDGRSRAASAAE